MRRKNMHTYPKVSIIVLNYNGKSCLEACLRSLDRIAYPKKEVIVIDNGSEDGSAFSALNKYPHFIFLFNKENQGFAKGMNRGMKYAFHSGAQFCVLFNYDATIESSAVETIIHSMIQNSNIGLASPLIYDTHRRSLWFGKGKINFWRMRAEHILPSDTEMGQKSYESAFLTGCCLFVSRQLVETIGFLDEHFFLYYEDVDYSLRAKKAGFLCSVIPSGVAYHEEKSNESSQKIYFLVLSGLLFFQKHTPFFLHPYMTFYVTIRRGKNWFERLFSQRQVSQDVLRAYNDFFHCEKP